MLLTIFRPKIANRMMMGSAATRVAAISPGQSGAPWGVWDRKTPSATVSTRAFSSLATISGHKYSFQAPM